MFGVKKPVIGVVHLLPLPGSPRYRGSLEEVLERALADAGALVEGGVDGLILENFGDKPFPKRRISREGLAAFAVVAREVVEEVSVPVGINVLRNDGLSAMAKRAAGSAPVFAGSGVVPENAVEVLAIADGAIVGTYFKIGGITENPVDRERVERLVSLVRRFYRK